MSAIAGMEMEGYFFIFPACFFEDLMNLFGQLKSGYLVNAIIKHLEIVGFTVSNDVNGKRELRFGERSLEKIFERVLFLIEGEEDGVRIDTTFGVLVAETGVSFIKEVDDVLF